MINGQDFFDYSVKIYLGNNDSKNCNYQGDDYTAVCLLVHPNFKKHCKMIAVELSKQQTVYADWKAIQQIIFTGIIDQEGTMFFIIEETKEIILELSKGTVRVL